MEEINVIDRRFQSGNSVPIQKATVPEHEWQALKAAAEKLASDRERLLLACRKAVLTLAHAAQANRLYEEDYQDLSKAISEVVEAKQ